MIVAAAPALRAGLRAILQDAGVQVVAEAAETSVPLPSQWERLGEGASANTLVLVAVDLPIEELPNDWPLVLLSGDPRQAAALRSLDLPGWALLPPDAAPEQLVAAVHAVAQGLTAMPVDSASALAAPLAVSDPLQEPLTPRELEVLQLVSHGLSNKLIARTLSISEHTVKFHVSATYAKLGAASRTEAVSLAARKGLISL